MVVIAFAGITNQHETCSFYHENNPYRTIPCADKSCITGLSAEVF